MRGELNCHSKQISSKLMAGQKPCLARAIQAVCPSTPDYLCACQNQDAVVDYLEENCSDDCSFFEIIIAGNAADDLRECYGL